MTPDQSKLKKVMRALGEAIVQLFSVLEQTCYWWSVDVSTDELMIHPTPLPNVSLRAMEARRKLLV